MKLVSITSMRNNSKKAKRIAEGYVATSRKPDLAIFVIDRCSDDTKAILEAVLSQSGLNYVLLDVPWSDNIFAAGRPRDYAIDCTLDKLLPEAECFVFLDGDCIPSTHLFAEYDRVFSLTFPYPTLVNSSRIDEAEDGTIIEDVRLASPYIFSPGKDIVTCCDMHLYVLVDNDMIPSCIGANTGLNKQAVILSRKLNEIVIGSSNAKRTFLNVFDGQWGGEDPYLATTLFRAGSLLVNMDPDKSHVIHTWHTSEHRTQAHVANLTKALHSFRISLNRHKLILDTTVVSVRPGLSTSRLQDTLRHSRSDSVTPTPITKIAYDILQDAVYRHSEAFALYELARLVGVTVSHTAADALCDNDDNADQSLLGLEQIDNECLIRCIRSYIFELQDFGNVSTLPQPKIYASNKKFNNFHISHKYSGPLR